MVTMAEARRTVVVAMSGGVDSSVAAALCVEAGHKVIGVMLRLWADPGAGTANRCCSDDAVGHAAAVAGDLGIAFRVLEAGAEFKRHVVDAFVAASAAGQTPNPCMECNRRIRFGWLLERVEALGGDVLVTGHYARVDLAPDGLRRLRRGVDPVKDQSYVLSILGQNELARVSFPLGGLTKSEVRRLAVRRGIAVADRPDSVDLCWLGTDGLTAFLDRNLPPDALVPGPIVDRSGRVLGTHRGLPRYTIGQRRGLGLSLGDARYVTSKDVARNALVVGDAGELGCRRLLAAAWHWVAGGPPAAGPWRVLAQTRYRSAAAPAVLEEHPDGCMVATFDHVERAVTPGQALVAYDGDICLGAGVIVGPAAR